MAFVFLQQLRGELIEVSFQATSTRSIFVSEMDRMELEARHRQLSLQNHLSTWAAANASIQENFDAAMDGIEAGLLKTSDLIHLRLGEFKLLDGKVEHLVGRMDHAFDMRGREQAIQELVSEVRRGKKDVDDLLAALGGQGNPLADKVRSIVAALRDRRIEVEEFAAELDRMQDVAEGMRPGSAFQAVLRLLEQLGLSGDLGQALDGGGRI